jgi:hypothetical protein
LGGAALGCGTTPLDSVVAESVTSGGTDTGGAGNSGGRGGSSGSGAIGAESGTGGSGGSGGPEGGSGGSGGGALDCQSPAPGRYLVRDRAGERCLQKGAEDTVFTAKIFNALLDADCSLPEAQWEFKEVIPNFYALHNFGIDTNLDVKAGLTTDGTPIVLYSPHPSDNQLFAFAARTPPYFALEPQNAVQKCVEVVGTGAQLFPCDDANQAQDFSLVRVDCP